MEPVDRRANRIARHQFGACTRRQLREVGIGPRTVRRRISRGGWSEPLPTVIDLGTHPVSWRQRLMHVLLAAGPRGAVSHHSAAHLHGLLDAAEPEGVDVVVPRGGRTRVGSLVLHTTSVLDPEDVVEVGPFRSTSLARTLLDVMPALGAARIEPMLWEAARRDRRLPSAVAEVLARHPRARGRTELQRLLAGLRPDVSLAQSPLEVVGLLALRRAGAPQPELQVVVRDGAGRFVGRVDAAWPAARMIVEFDGATFHDPPRLRAADEERRRQLRSLGWHVVVLRADDVRRPARCRRVAQEVNRRLQPSS